MTKEYFAHDYDASNDPKIVAMVSVHKAAGYGLYWHINELLHKTNGHKIPLKKYMYLAIAKQMETSVEFVEKFIIDCIEQFELYEMDGTCFYSERVLRNMTTRAELSEKRSMAGQKSVISRQISTSVEQELTSVQQNSAKGNKLKETKRKEIKELYTEFPFFQNGFGEVWKDYLDMRVKIRKPATQRAEQLELTLLNKLSGGKKEVAIAIVNQSVRKSWQSLYPLREEDVQIERQKTKQDLLMDQITDTPSDVLYNQLDAENKKIVRCRWQKLGHRYNDIGNKSTVGWYLKGGEKVTPR